jgi:hypothetical protein
MSILETDIPNYIYDINPLNYADVGNFLRTKYSNEKIGTIKSALSILKTEDIIQERKSDYSFNNLPDDISLIEDGVYMVKLSEKGRYTVEGKRIRDEATAVNQSVIDTNNSVKDTNTATQKLYNEILPNNFKSQKTATNISIGVGILSLIFIGLSTYYQATDKTAKEVQTLKDTITETQKKLQTIESSLREINSSIQKVTTDTILVKQKKTGY